MLQHNIVFAVTLGISNMKIIILLGVLGISTANILQYGGINYDGINMPNNNYHPSFEKPYFYHYQNNYVVKPHITSQHPSMNGPVCATHNGIWRTFPNIYQFKNEINKGNAWIFYSTGNCPQIEKPSPEPLEPICATSNNKLKTFANSVALEVENIVTGKNWVKLFVGVCPLIPSPTTTTASPPLPNNPSVSQPVCGTLNGVWKTFSNITMLNLDIAKGWTFFSLGACANSEVCARFNNEFRTFSSITAVEVDKIVNGKNWVIIASGVCVNSPPTSSNGNTTSPISSFRDLLPGDIGDNSASLLPSVGTPSTTEKIIITTVDPNTTTILEDSTTDSTIPSGGYTNQRIQQNNNYNGPYVEGSFHYNHNTFNQANIKPYYRKKY